VSPRRAPRRRRNRGFSLLIVFLLVGLMLAVAAPVLLTTQEDLAVAGQDRESLTSFYAAEYAVAQAKDWIAKQMQTVDPGLTNFPVSGWGPLLAVLATANEGCKSGPATLATAPIAPRMSWRDFNGPNGAKRPFTLGPGNAMFQFCIHNNSDDPAYLDVAGNTGTACSGKDGDSCDARDPLHYLAVDVWGAFPVDANTGQPLSGAAITHLAINIGPPTLRQLASVGSCSYSSVEGGCGSHSGNGGVVDTTVVNIPRQ
jgi:type II secretory pathway pseudopilin PulG